jgi:hypothetical protein
LISGVAELEGWSAVLVLAAAVVVGVACEYPLPVLAEDTEGTTVCTKLVVVVVHVDVVVLEDVVVVVVVVLDDVVVEVLLHPALFPMSRMFLKTNRAPIGFIETMVQSFKCSMSKGPPNTFVAKSEKGSRTNWRRPGV